MEGLFKLAFPKHKVSKSKSLIEHFVQNIPTEKRMIIQSQIMSHKLRDKKTDWKFIQKCSQLLDIDTDVTKRESRKETNEEEIIINLGYGSNNRKYNKNKYLEKPKVQTNNNNQYRSFTNRNRRNYENANVNFQNRNTNTLYCNICKRKGHSRTSCWYRSEACFICASLDHWAKECPSKPKPAMIDDRARRVNHKQFQQQQHRNSYGKDDNNSNYARNRHKRVYYNAPAQHHPSRHRNENYSSRPLEDYDNVSNEEAGVGDNLN